MTTIKSIFTFAYLLLAFTINAQFNGTVDNYYMEHFGEEEGLQNTIYSILPDKDGFLWIATSNGIARFNGYEILPVPIKGTMYKNSYSNVSKLHYKGNDTIIAYSAFLDKVAIIVKDKIVGIKDQNIEEDGLLFSNQVSPKKVPAYLTGNIYTSEFGEKEKLNTVSRAFSLVGGIYDNDIVWIVLNDGIGFYDKDSLVHKVSIPKLDAGKVVSVGNQIFYLDKRNYLNHYTAKGLQKRISLNIPSRRELAIFNDRFGNDFFCVADSDLYKVIISASGKLSLQKLMTGLKYPSEISVVFEKDSNTIVTGTFKKGMYVYKKNLLKVSEPLPAGLTNSFFIQHLLPDSQTIFTGKEYLLKSGIYCDKKINGFEQNSYGILKDNKGRYWYGISKYILRTREIGVNADTIKRINGLYPEILLEDKDGRIWIASESEFGYVQNDKYTEVRIKDLKDRRINCMKQEATGRYLIGTDWGFFVWNNIHEANTKEIPHFKSTHIRQILPEDNGLIWICTYGNGFFLMENDKVISLSDNNNNLAFVHTIIEDSNGYCWLPSNNGLFVTTRKSLIDYSKDRTNPPFFYMFTKKDGLRTNEFNGGTEPSYIRFPNGDISLASMDGLVSFNPAKMHFSFSASPIIVNQILLDSSEIEESDSFNIGNNINNIHLSLSTSYWGYQENSVFEYQVIEKDATPKNNRWLSISQDGEINLFSPDHGKYQLIIRKRIGLGAKDYLIRTINFYVLPKWYQTKAFLVAAILGILGMMIAISTWRRNYYRRVNRILKEKVDIATLRLKLMNNTLEKKVEERTHTIQEAEKRFRTLVEKSLVGVYIVQDDKFLYVNPRYEEIFGYNSSELYNMSPLSIIKKDLRAATSETIIGLMSGEIDSEHSETIGIKKDGTERLLEFYASKTMYEGKPTIIGTVLDITEKKLLEKKMLEQKVQEQKKITRAILKGEERERNKIGQELHDNINQILAVTKMSLSRAKKATVNKEDVIAESLQLIDDVIEEIRALSRGKVTPIRKVNLQELLQPLIDTMTVNNAINASLVYKGEDKLIKDELKLNIYRIIQELLNNILKHAKANNVVVFVEAGGSQIKLWVSDDGKGFDPDMHAGGIGISNITNRVESFNGNLFISSSPGNGCQTKITFPVKQQLYQYSGEYK
ncbi:MAG: PAS domain S-box protein [Bacteroidota bacterium]